MCRSLEGISYLWLQNPEILADPQECQAVFKIIFERF